MMKIINDRLIEAVNVYYDWHGDRNVHVKKFIVNKDGYEMLVVRFIDKYDDKKTSLMDASGWADGHWDVTEMFVGNREWEKEMIEEFEQTGYEYIDQMDERYWK